MYAVHLPLCQILSSNHTVRTEERPPLFSIHQLIMKRIIHYMGLRFYCMLNATPKILPLSRPTYATVATATPLLISRTVSTLKVSSGTSVYMCERAHCISVRNIQAVPSTVMRSTRMMKYLRSTCSLFIRTSVSEWYSVGCILSTG
jgi:hypothetical protein